MASDKRERLQARTVPERVLATSASTLPVLTPAMVMSTGAGGRNSHQAPRAANPVTASRAFFTVMSFDIYRLTLELLPPRSEEHTSELQSRENLVCRLLL